MAKHFHEKSGLQHLVKISKISSLSSLPHYIEDRTQNEGKMNHDISEVIQESEFTDKIYSLEIAQNHVRNQRSEDGENGDDILGIRSEE